MVAFIRYATEWAPRLHTDSKAPTLVPAIELLGIRAAGENGESAIQLLDEHDAGQFVRVGHRAQRNFLHHTFAECIRKTISVAADKDYFASATVALLAKPLRKGGGIVWLAAGIEEQDGCGAVGVDFFECSGFVADFGDFDGAGTVDTLDVIGEKCNELGAASLAQHE